MENNKITLNNGKMKITFIVHKPTFDEIFARLIKEGSADGEE